jgi:hypothetical protein
VFEELSSTVHPGRAQIFFGAVSGAFSRSSGIFPSLSTSLAGFSDSPDGGVSSGGVFFLAARIRFAWIGQISPSKQNKHTHLPASSS